MRFALSYVDARGELPSLSGGGGTATLTPLDGQAAFTKVITLDADATTAPQAALVIAPGDYSTLTLPVSLRVSAPMTAGGQTYVVDFLTSILPNDDGIAGGVTLSLEELIRPTWGSKVSLSMLNAGEEYDVRAAMEDAVSLVSEHGRFLYGHDGLAGSAWRNWARLEALAILARTYRKDDSENLRRERDRARTIALDTASTGSPATGSLQSLAFTWENLRRYIAVVCAKNQRRRFFPDIGSLDAAIERTLTEWYNKARWSYRTRHSKATIGIDKSVTWDLDASETMEKIATRKLVYEDHPNGPYLCPVIDADHAARLRSDTKAKTARPLWFTMTRSGSSWTYDFYPAPDKAYSAYSAVHLGGPRIPTGASAADATAELADIPSSFHPFLRTLCLAAVFDDHRLFSDAEKFRAGVSEQIEQLLYELDDRGSVEDDGVVRDVYGDLDALSQGPFNLGGAM